MILQRNWPAMLALMGGIACSGGARPAASGRVDATTPMSPGSSPDTSLFAAVLRSLPGGSGYVLRVDPRPLNAVSDVVIPHETDLAAVADTVTAQRLATARRLGAIPADAVDGSECEQGPGGLHRAPTAPGAAPSTGRPFCVIAALPRPGGAYFPRAGIDRRSSAPDGAVTTRVIVITASFTVVYDVVAAQRDGEWRIVDRAELYRSWS